jgi:hypothetical protein
MRILLAVFMLFFTADFQAYDDQSKISPQLMEVVLTVPLDCLTIDAQGISLIYEGNLLAVHSLEKSGEMWIVKAGQYCPNGHRVVCRCGGCAISSCGYCCSCYSDDYRKPS